MFACMVIERNSINWLYNRNGCTYSKFQKIIELELRMNAINKDYGKPPKYDTNRYRNHYFYPDFEIIQKKMTEDYQTS